MSSRFTRVMTVTLVLALFLIVFGSKLAVIDRFGSDLPNWDQWDAEGAQVFLPYFQHRLGFLDFFTPHNEHRVACTRALALGLLVLNGQWDARLECVVNAALHSALALAIFLYGRTLISRRWHGVWFAIVAALTAPPIAWQNVLGGFHSQQYFLLWFSLAALAWLLTAPSWTGRWWGGVACAGLALFSMGSGLLAAAVAAAVLGISDRPRAVWRRHGATLVACLLVFAAGWVLRVEVSQNEPMKAHSLADFGLAFWRSLQWPVGFYALLAVLVWLPWIRLGWLCWRQRNRVDPRLRVIFAAGLWVILQFAATAYGRGANGGWPASRYLDTVDVGLLVNALALLLAFSPVSAPRWRIWLRAAVVASWFGVVGYGEWQHVVQMFDVELPTVRTEMRERELNTRAYLATGDARHLDHDIPYPGKDGLIERLSHPEIRAILPVSVRPPIALDGMSNPPSAFVRDGVADPTPRLAEYRTWGSFTPAGAAAQGEWRSAPIIRPTLSYWKIEVAGYLGQPGLSLELISLTTGMVLATVVPTPLPRESWCAAYVRALDTAAVLVARDASASQWFAFSEPVEMGRFSYWAWRLATGGRFIALAAGGAAILLFIGLSWLPGLNKPAPAIKPGHG